MGDVQRGPAACASTRPKMSQSDAGGCGCRSRTGHPDVVEDEGRRISVVGGDWNMVYSG